MGNCHHCNREFRDGDDLTVVGTDLHCLTCGEGRRFWNAAQGLAGDALADWLGIYRKSTIASALAFNDPNGCYTRDDLESEGLPPLYRAELVFMVGAVLSNSEVPAN